MNILGNIWVLICRCFIWCSDTISSGVRTVTSRFSAYSARRSFGVLIGRVLNRVNIKDRISEAWVSIVWHALILLLLLLRGTSGSSSKGISYVEGRGGTTFRALPGVRSGWLPVCDSGCDVFGGKGVAVLGAGCVCGCLAGSGKSEGAGSDGPASRPPNANPKSTCWILRVLAC